MDMILQGTSAAFSRVNALTQEQRDAAYDAARKRIAGAYPQEQTSAVEGRFPKRIARTVTALCVGMLVYSFLPSAMRLNAIAIATNAEIMGHATSVYVAALSTVLMAEIGQIIFSLAAAINDSRWQRYLLLFGALICTLIALSGNAVAMGNHALENLFAFLDTFAPPVLVLITAQILKTQMLHATEAKHTTERSYKNAVAKWNADYAAANATPEWNETLANAIRDALRSANRGSKAVLRDLTNVDWYALIKRERSAEEWWKVAEQDAAEDQARRDAELQRLRDEAELRSALEEQMRIRQLDATQNGTHSTGATGEVAAARLIRRGDLFVKVCPECKKQFTGDTQRKATNSLVAHMRVHVRERASASALTNVPALEDDTEPVEVSA